MIRKPMNRRAVLRGMLQGTGVALGLPLLEAMTGRGDARANGLLPKRFGLFFWGNGNLPDRWTPVDTGPEWTPSEQLAPLAAHTDVVSVVSGTMVKLPNLVPHGTGAGGILSAAPLGGQEDQILNAKTIDQIIADEIGGDTLYRSLQTAATDFVGLSFSGPNARNPAETSPYALYDRLFGPTFVEPGTEGIVDPTLGLRRSVLDAVMGDIGTLESRVGAADKARLDQHLTGIRELEQRLARLEDDPPDLAACVKPDAPEAEYPDIDGRPQIAARHRVMCELLAMAFACDQTRVFAHFISPYVTDVLFDGASAGHHDLTHNEPAPQPEVHDITLQIMEHYATMVEVFRGIPEGEGTLLDACALFGCSEISEGRTHRLDEIPILIAGNACGSLVQGIHARSDTQESSTKVLLSLIRAMDIPMAEYGEDEAQETDGFTEIEA